MLQIYTDDISECRLVVLIEYVIYLFEKGSYKHGNCEQNLLEKYYSTPSLALTRYTNDV